MFFLEIKIKLINIVGNINIEIVKIISIKFKFDLNTKTGKKEIKIKKLVFFKFI